jgi:hypothetical protein
VRSGAAVTVYTHSGPTKKEREGIEINDQLNIQGHNVLPSKTADND